MNLHDRLLERIDDLEAAYALLLGAVGADDPDAALYREIPLGEAVRAVVELHAPHNQAGARLVCFGCDQYHRVDGVRFPDWPCSTISRVAAALGVELDDQ